MTQSFSPYKKRPIRHLGVRSLEDWRLKIYGISSRAERPTGATVDAAWALLPGCLGSMPVDVPHYHLGFLIVHEANDGNFIVFDWWAGENMLCTRVFYAPIGSLQFEDFTHTRIIACVWELEAIHFERNAWVRHVLERADAPDFEAYLAESLNADV